MAGDWHPAKSLEVLLHEINAKFPNRSKESDGLIGDVRHQQEKSDHNPNAQGVVCAMDITQDPAHGADMGPISEMLVQRKHPALKYAIFNRRINGRHTNWAWQDYHGADPHTSHLHVSVGIGEDGESTGPYDDVSPWGVAGDTPLPPPPQPGQFHTWGSDVRVHSKPSVHSEVVHTLPGPTPIHVAFQVHAENVVADGFTNNAWAFVPDLGGFLSNIYIDVPAQWLPGVPEGGQPPPPPGPPPGPPLVEFRTWGSDVRVHSKPSVHSEVVHTLPGPTPIHVAHQVHAENVVAAGFSNDGWAFIPDFHGFLSNIYIDVPVPWLPGVPEGGQPPPPGPPPGPGPQPGPPPGPPQPQPGDFTTWGHDVRVHSKPSANSEVLRTLDGPTPIHVAHQVHGEEVHASGYTNNAWAFIPAFNGFLSNIYVNSPQQWLPGVPEGGGPTPPPPPPPPHGGPLPSVDGLSPDQMRYAKIIVEVGEQQRIPPRGIIIALATAMQESSLRNADFGDTVGPDSRGLFQQRSNWGTLQQRMDPAYAARAFYGREPLCHCNGLWQVTNWQNMTLTQAAQAVQHSGKPDAYAKHERIATDLFNALR